MNSQKHQKTWLKNQNTSFTDKKFRMKNQRTLPTKLQT